MKIVIATGGSGGHLFPALQVAYELNQKGHEVEFMGSFRFGIEMLVEKGFMIHQLDARGIDFKNPWTFSKTLFTHFTATIKSLGKLRMINPDVVLGFGGYGAFPIVFSALLLRLPTLIHEQNVVPGKANALLAQWVKKVAISFEESKRYFNQSKTVLTGCPSHGMNALLTQKQARMFLNLSVDKKTILVLGGSQGSHRINQEFIKTAKRLNEQMDFQIIHVCGQRDFGKLEKEYKQLDIPVALYEFIHDIEYAYSAADLIISRAGAVTITEIALFKIPTILIPYP